MLASTAGRKVAEPYQSQQAGRSQRAKAACSEQQYPQEGEQTAFSPFFAISHLLPAWVPITATLSSGPSPHVIHFSRAFPGFGSPSETLQAGMNILAIPRWPQTPTLSATQDFLFFHLLAALHKPSGSMCHLHAQDKKWGSPLRPSHLLTCQVEPS